MDKAKSEIDETTSGKRSSEAIEPTGGDDENLGRTVGESSPVMLFRPYGSDEAHLGTGQGSL